MEIVLSNAEMRRADEYTINNGTPSAELMLRAGKAIAEEVITAANALGMRSVLVVCGTGNNGGDGYVCARILGENNFDVKVYAVESALSPDCAREKTAYKYAYSNDIAGAIIVDCLFGTGLCRNISGKFAEIVSAINDSGAYVISADIPSGINGDNGLVLGCAVKANLTVAVQEYKFGHFLGDGIDYCGKIVKKNIGISCHENCYAKLYCPEDIAKFYPKRARNSHKGTYGTANLIVGSNKYIGAAALAAEAALKSGCGYVKLTSESAVKSALAARLPQVVYTEDVDFSANAIAVGSGCGVSEKLYALIKNILSNYVGTLVIDADGLNALAKYGVEVLKNKNCAVTITPHLKEFSRISGLSTEQILLSPVDAAKNFSKEYNVTVLLKGAASVIARGDKVAINVRGNTALAKAGSGDMLTGYLCGTLARGLSPFDAAVCAAYTLGLAAEIAAQERTEYCATAKDVLKNLHFSVKRLTTL